MPQFPPSNSAAGGIELVCQIVNANSKSGQGIGHCGLFSYLFLGFCTWSKLMNCLPKASHKQALEEDLTFRGLKSVEQSSRHIPNGFETKNGYVLFLAGQSSRQETGCMQFPVRFQ
jgi:hypothetical protein